MASTAYYPFFGCNIPGVAIIAFSFKTNNGGAIDQTLITPTGASKVASVTRTATAGIHTVTMTDDSFDVLHSSTSVEDTSTPDAARSSIRFSGTNGRLASPLSFTLNTFSSGILLADLAVGRVVSVFLVVRKSQGR